MANFRLFKHPSSAGDRGDAYLYLQALVEESENAAKDFEDLVRIYAIKTFSEVAHRVEVAESYTPRPKQLLRGYLKRAKKHRGIFQREPFKGLDLLGSLLPVEAYRVVTTGNDGEAFHRKVMEKLARLNKEWLNDSENGSLALILALGILTSNTMGEDREAVFRRTPLLRELIFGSKERSRSADTKTSHKLAQRIRKVAKQRGYQNKSRELRLEHARLAVKVIHQYHGSLEDTLAGENDNQNCPTSRSTLSEIIQPFYKSLGIELKRGPKPFEGLNPIHLPERIRRMTTFLKPWYRHK